MTPLITRMYDYANSIKAEQSGTIGGKSGGYGGGLGGLIGVNVDNANKSMNFHPTLTDNTNDVTYSPYAPITHTVNFTITDSMVEDTGNTQYSNPTTFTPTMTQTTTPTNTETTSSGIDLTSILVPVAGIAGVAALAYAAMTIFGDGKKAETKKKSGGQKNE